ncbi:hypothetical protein TraAM80_06234 [Trypanosoma rangeli]|uniref:Uncharacterized protein n=1 Tax=Trypanosoma rangeli TaxID=5698 RepID=A0A422NBE1_TRYRA|nr:uncharacterized protein TraAM80_06234 [Trypanosoma rangeli]RNF02783.1 hypothetical protein TraAM80_06234 [Trypanosoma rangeli]|eukprot:RNF02783.1 hypothetical protein TraAM80_06234 [Trypanosoma rangeli]
MKTFRSLTRTRTVRRVQRDMIRVVAPDEGVLQEMLLLELQGKVVIPPKMFKEAREQQQQQRDQREDVLGAKHPRDADEALTQADASGGVLGQETVMEVPLGLIANDPRNERRCSLRIGSLLVEGSRGRYSEPLLVLKQRKPPRDQCPVPEAQERPRVSSSLASTSRCCLLQEWLAEHPEELTLDAAFAAVDTNVTPTKTYELVGIVERYVHLNSKPLRTLL